MPRSTPTTATKPKPVSVKTTTAAKPVAVNNTSAAKPRATSPAKSITATNPNPKGRVAPHPKSITATDPNTTKATAALPAIHMRTQPRPTSPPDATGNFSAGKPKPAKPPLARELEIAQLAVQLAAVLTKRFQFDELISAMKSRTGTSSTNINQDLHETPSSTTTSNGAATGTGGQGHPLFMTKDDDSMVTIADFAAQAVLISAIRSAFPDDSIIGEEDSNKLKADADLRQHVWRLVSTAKLEDPASDAKLKRPRDENEMMAIIDLGKQDEHWRPPAGKRVWCLDPVDGTSRYKEGKQYAISLSLLRDGQELLGVLGCPNRKFQKKTPLGQWKVYDEVVDKDGMGLMLSAVKGQGAEVRKMVYGGLQSGMPVNRGRGKVDLTKAHFVDSVESKATDSTKVIALAKEIGASEATTNLYASHMRYAAIVLGGREFVQLRWPKNKNKWSIWDHAGSHLIYAESGAGKVTDLFGRSIDFHSGVKIGSHGIITADASIHAEIVSKVETMRKAEAEARKRGEAEAEAPKREKE